jgi:hypothetical protein
MVGQEIGLVTKPLRQRLEQFQRMSGLASHQNLGCNASAWKECIVGQYVASYRVTAANFDKWLKLQASSASHN